MTKNKMIKDILRAKEIIEADIKKTSLIPSKIIGEKSGINLYFKPECFQKTGSFKIRGVLNKLHYLKSAEKKRGIITFSAGSHALSLAYAASLLGIPSTAVMPKTAPLNKIRAIKDYGTKIIFTAKSIIKKCREIQEQCNLTIIHPFDDPLIIAGQGTIGLEILKELPDVDMVFVPVGGGGLISGVAIAMKLKKPTTKIIGIEPGGAASMFHSICRNKIVHLKSRQTVAECLAAPCVGKYTLDYVKKYVDDIVLVSDKEIIEAMRLIWKKHKIKTEPSAAASLTPILSGKIKIPKNTNVVCILTGGNIDEKRFKNFLKFPLL